jgi:hypothetical protein
MAIMLADTPLLPFSFSDYAAQLISAADAVTISQLPSPCGMSVILYRSQFPC